jgi:mono/diheme cytochrome c family protein
MTRFAMLLAALALASVVGARESRAQASGAPGARGATSRASTAAAAASSGPTTLVGVYTEAQATRGKDVYAGNCRSCHSPQSHTGETFETWWHGKQLSELFIFVATRMPQNDPGALPPEDVADVVAYLLQMNAMPTGKRELYPDADSLKQYRIELKSRDSTVTRTKP